ncbi:unnamed protein product, partial [marine sediment metagenome]
TYIEVDDSSQKINSEITEAITVEAWIQPSSVTLNETPMIASKGDIMYFYFLDGSLHFFLRFTDGTTDFIDSGAIFEGGKWYHIVGTYNGSEMKIFVDGKEKDVLSKDNKTIESDNRSLFIGKHRILGYNFNGRIDEFRLYGEGFSAAQIKKHYVEGAKGKGLLVGEK